MNCRNLASLALLLFYKFLHPSFSLLLLSPLLLLSSPSPFNFHLLLPPLSLYTSSLLLLPPTPPSPPPLPSLPPPPPLSPLPLPIPPSPPFSLFPFSALPSPPTPSFSPPPLPLPPPPSPSPLSPPPPGHHLLLDTRFAFLYFPRQSTPVVMVPTLIPSGAQA